jgi:hypothetical protein
MTLCDSCNILALAPRRLGVARRAPNRVVNREKFAHVALRLRKERSKLSELGKWLEEDPARWKRGEIDSHLKEFL